VTLRVKRFERQINDPRKKSRAIKPKGLNRIAKIG